MAEKKLTPIQEAISFWTERYKEAKSAGAMKTMESADIFLQYLNALLPKEKEFAKDMWEDGGDQENNVRHKRVNEEMKLNWTFDEFYKQYEP